MIVDKESIDFKIVDHKIILTPVGKYQIEFKIGDDKYWITNAGIIKVGLYKYMCPLAFYKQQAKKYIAGLPDQIYIEDYENT